MSEEAPGIETPAAVAALDKSIRRDLAAVRLLFVEGGGLLAELEEVLRVLPASQSRLRAWRNQAEEMCRQIEEESDDVKRKLLGEGPGIASSVDEARVLEVRAARKDAAA